MACRSRKSPTDECVMYRDLSRFTLTPKEATTTILENMKKNKVHIYNNYYKYLYIMHIIYGFKI